MPVYAENKSDLMLQAKTTMSEDQGVMFIGQILFKMTESFHETKPAAD